MHQFTHLRPEQRDQEYSRNLSSCDWCGANVQIFLSIFSGRIATPGANKAEKVMQEAGSKYSASNNHVNNRDPGDFSSAFWRWSRVIVVMRDELRKILSCTRWRDYACDDGAMSAFARRPLVRSGHSRRDRLERVQLNSAIAIAMMLSMASCV